MMHDSVFMDRVGIESGGFINEAKAVNKKKEEWT
jgi:hypothetical protein